MTILTQRQSVCSAANEPHEGALLLESIIPDGEAATGF